MQKPASVLSLIKLLFSTKPKFSAIFFYQGFLLQTLTIHMTAREEGGQSSYRSEHSDICFQLCIWNDYLVFFIVSQIITRLLLDELNHLCELAFDCQSHKWWIWAFITLVSKANQLSVFVTSRHFPQYILNHQSLL